MSKKILVFIALGLAILAPPLSGQLPGPGHTNQIPWFCGFEEDEGYLNGMALVDGWGGWYACSTNAFVQTLVVCTDPPYTDSLMAAAIGEETVLSNRFDGTPANIWIQMDVRALLDEDGQAPQVDTNATMMFYITSNGYFCAQHITNRSEPSTNWVVFSNAVTGNDVDPYDTNQWARLNIYQNYSNQTWALFLDSNLITNSINFVNTNASGFRGFDVFNRGFDTAYIDNISITNDLPDDLQAAGGDWLPDLKVSTNAFTHHIFAGQQITNTFEVWKTTNWYDLVFSNSVSEDWLWLDIYEGVSTGETDKVTVTVIYNTTNLAEGVHHATITVEGRDPEFGFTAQDSPHVINVTLAATVPDLKVEPLGLTNEVAQGYKANAQSFRVWNDSEPPRGPMEYSVDVIEGGTWMAVSPKSGVCTDFTNTVSVFYDTAALDPGWYTGAVRVVSSGVNSQTQDVDVVMRVKSKPVLWVSEPHSWINVISEGESLPDVSFNVRNSSEDDPMGTLRYEVTDEMEWISIKSGGTGTSTGELKTVTFSYHTHDLSPGVYTGAITVAGTDDATGDTANNSPVIMNVELTVRGSVTLSTSLRGITNTLLQGYSQTNLFTIWNSGGEPWMPMSYTVSKNKDWMSLDKASGTVTDSTNTISAVLSTGDLKAGSYRGRIRIDAHNVETGERAGRAPQTRDIVLVVESRKPKNFELPEIVGIPQVGQILEADEGIWQRESRLTFAYQWQRASTIWGDDLVDIPGAVGKTYQVTEEDKGFWLRVRVTATDAEPTPLHTTVCSRFKSSTRIKAVTGDFSGDGKTDLWFYDLMSGTWRIAHSGGGTVELQWGWWETQPVLGDFSGSGVMDFVVYHEETGIWYLLLMPGYQFAFLQWGGPDTVPVVGDYDGDGKSDFAVYWEPGGFWFIVYSSDWTFDFVQFGGPDSIPVPADYTGDGVTEKAIYENGVWTISTANGTMTVELGGAHAYPVPGDYDGDGIADIAVYWFGENRWEILLSSTGEVIEKSFGIAHGSFILPVPGYYDEDNQLDPATLHIHDGRFLVWSIQRSLDGYRGQSYEPAIDMWRVNWR